MEGLLTRSSCRGASARPRAAGPPTRSAGTSARSCRATSARRRAAASARSSPSRRRGRRTRRRPGTSTRTCRRPRCCVFHNTFVGTRPSSGSSRRHYAAEVSSSSKKSCEVRHKKNRLPRNFRPNSTLKKKDMATLRRTVLTDLYRSEEEICADRGYDAPDAKT